MSASTPLPRVTEPSPPAPGPKPAVIAGVLGGVLVVGVGAFLLLRHPATAAAAVAVQPLQVEGGSVTLAPGAPQWRYVELKEAKTAAPLPPLPSPARVDFDERRTANVGTPLAGRVDQLFVRIGDQVKKGDKLFTIRSGAFADLAKELDTAREEVRVKKRLYERSQELFSLKAAPEKDVLTAEADFKAAELALKAAEAKQQSLSVRSTGEGIFEVHAPRDGTVVDVDVALSQEVAPEREKPLVRLSDLDQVLVLADVQEGDVGDVVQGSKVKITVSNGAVVREGVVERISSMVDPRRRTVEVRVRAENKDRALRPNAWAEVELLPQDGSPRVVVPEAAVVSEGQTSLVFIDQGDSKLGKQVVTTGRRRNGQVEVRKGLEPGQRYVAKGALLLLNQVELAE
ncbi:MAG: efflux RND transporter periplasmic adaptor subunit [Myxococcaceae bacterium]|nr:efflux RND transporter periplasmic adaptor subunit [Myxococcaceae bacterium]